MTRMTRRPSYLPSPHRQEVPPGAALAPLAAVLDAAATYAAPWASPEAQRVARQTCVDQIDAALDRCGEDGASNLVFELAFRLALRDQL